MASIWKFQNKVAVSYMAFQSYVQSPFSTCTISQLDSNLNFFHFCGSPTRFHSPEICLFLYCLILPHQNNSQSSLGPSLNVTFGQHCFRAHNVSYVTSCQTPWLHASMRLKYTPIIMCSFTQTAIPKSNKWSALNQRNVDYNFRHSNNYISTF